MNAKIKWEDQAHGLGWLGSSVPAPVPVRSRVRWHGNLGVNPEDTPGFKACWGNLLQKCGQWKDENGTPLWQLPGWSTFPNNPSAKATLAICMTSAHDICLLQAGAESGVVLTSDQIKERQNKINALLKQYDYCPIGADGKLGGETCGAAVWAAGVDSSLVVPAACANIKSNFQLKNCPGGGGGGGGPPKGVPCKAGTDCAPEQICVNGFCVDCPAGQARDASGNCAAPKKTASSETPWGLFALGASALAAIGLVFLKAPKIPAREADVARDNPWTRRRAA